MVKKGIVIIFVFKKAREMWTGQKKLSVLESILRKECNTETLRNYLVENISEEDIDLALTESEQWHYEELRNLEYDQKLDLYINLLTF